MMEQGNRKAFLDMLAYSEIGPQLLTKSDNGYNVIVGSTAAKPDIFSSYAAHPNKLIQLRQGLASTAAGRYQLLYRYAVIYMRQLGLSDFSPESQDAIAIQQIRERKALSDIDAGRFTDAVSKCRNIWASLPGAGYGQPEHSIEKLQAAYQDAGGVLA